MILMHDRTYRKRLEQIKDLEKDLKEAYDCLVPNELVNGRELIDNISNDLKELKGSDSNERN